MSLRLEIAWHRPFEQRTPRHWLVKAWVKHREVVVAKDVLKEVQIIRFRNTIKEEKDNILWDKLKSDPILKTRPWHPDKINCGKRGGKQASQAYKVQ